mmetsp:Transcript_34638/g.98151  ORF Transcript_34638/g.98151 Transcript_34638/m.98151 type:complete len:100 (-) Transcript_34638:263-562(-)
MWVPCCLRSCHEPCQRPVYGPASSLPCANPGQHHPLPTACPVPSASQHQQPAPPQYHQQPPPQYQQAYAGGVSQGVPVDQFSQQRSSDYEPSAPTGPMV